MQILIITKQLSELSWGCSRKNKQCLPVTGPVQAEAQKNVHPLNDRVTNYSPIYSNRHKQHLYPGCGNFRPHLGQVSSAMVTCSSTSTGTQVRDQLCCIWPPVLDLQLRSITGTHKTSTFCLKVRRGKTNLPLGSISLPGSSRMLGILVAYAWWHKWRNSQDWCNFHVPCEYRWLSERRIVKNLSPGLKTTKLCWSLPFSS